MVGAIRLDRCADNARYTRAASSESALVVSLGAGKSMTAREALPLFIARLKAAGLPHRVLWTVPTHRLGGEALEKMDTLGLRVCNIAKAFRPADLCQIGAQAAVIIAGRNQSQHPSHPRSPSRPS